MFVHFLGNHELVSTHGAQPIKEEEIAPSFWTLTVNANKRR